MTKRRALILSVVLTLAVTSAAAGAGADAAPARGIQNIRTFLDQCPSNDPAFSSILLDFELRRDGRPITVPFCSEPVSQMPVAEYTDELLVLQGLRVMYAMDRGQSGHLPWTSLTLYDWMKSKIGGINILTSGGSYCCTTYDGKTFINVGAQNDANRQFDKMWIGISGNIDLYAHEARHVDGFPHVSCCGLTAGCDNVFDRANLSPYGVQWWLNSLWESGTINVGMGCLSADERSMAANWFRGALKQFQGRFCSNAPATPDAPSQLGGACAPPVKRRAVRK
jgi:hypothetical protein